MTSSLHTLAQQYALELGFDDVFGNRVEATEAGLRLVLGAMGVAAETDEAVTESLSAKQQANWQAGLEPINLYRHGKSGGFGVKVLVPETALHEPVQWHIELEAGVVPEPGLVLNGTFYPDKAPREEEAPEGVVSKTIAVWLDLPTTLPLGYHRLHISPSWALRFASRAQSLLLVAPHQCYLPPLMQEGKRLWGISAQLYSLRSSTNWGVGDLTDLKTLLQQSASQGASLVGLNPLHALYPHNPHHFSPYSPSSRVAFNSIYVAIEAIAEYGECTQAQDIVASSEYQQAFAVLRDSTLVDYPWVNYLKMQVLEVLFEHFKTVHLQAGTPRAQAFEVFCAEQGERLKGLATYQALHEHLMKQDETQWGWPVWPERYQHPKAAGVAQFAWEHKERVQFYQYLQWVFDVQLAEAQAEAKRLGQPVGLYLDLAVGADRAGYDLWCDQDLYSFKASLGCPPDKFNQLGQNWGLPPLLPEALSQAEYAPFIAMVRQNMKHAGALRFDHALSLFRVYWVPTAGTAKDGAYVRYPSEHLLAILAIESHRNQCLVIGEDLGTVPAFVTQALADWQVLSYKVFFFEKGADNQLLPPEAYPKTALVTVSTHDLPTLCGYWEGTDITLRQELELFPNEEALQHERNARPAEKRAIVQALANAGLVAQEHVDWLANDPHVPEAVMQGVHTFLARTPCLLQMVQLEELVAQTEQMNMPGTTTQHPNWRRRCPVRLEALVATPSAKQALAGVTLAGSSRFCLQPSALVETITA